MAFAVGALPFHDSRAGTPILDVSPRVEGAGLESAVWTREALVGDLDHLPPIVRTWESHR